MAVDEGFAEVGVAVFWLTHAVAPMSAMIRTIAAPMAIAADPPSLDGVASSAFRLLFMLFDRPDAPHRASH
jgi:hypothetical protein